MAGATAASVLGRQGHRVMLVDPRPRCAPRLKAEKIAQDQARLLLQLDLLDLLVPHAGRVREVRAVYHGRVFKTLPLEQYGLPYADMVNALRSRLPAAVTCRLGHVREIANSPEAQVVRLDGGEELTARLVVLACGVSQAIQTSLGLRRRTLQQDQCFVFGFTVTAANHQPFDFDAVTCYPTTVADRIDYLSLFRYPASMRANLFVFRSGDDPWIRRFLAAPVPTLDASLPWLKRVIGDYRLAGPVDSGAVDLYVTEGAPIPGVVTIGDAYESACPATGLGLNKVFTDVTALSECVPRWFATSGMGADKLEQFYKHPKKHALDEDAIQRARSERAAVLDHSLRWRIRRLVMYLERHLNSLRHG
jgi:2-polyprenyl-6-methoxyphenol hydroxylase-like FAD-dependent oxidoreductase